MGHPFKKVKEFLWIVRAFFGPHGLEQIRKCFQKRSNPSEDFLTLSFLLYLGINMEVLLSSWRSLLIKTILYCPKSKRKKSPAHLSLLYIDFFYSFTSITFGNLTQNSTSHCQKAFFFWAISTRDVFYSPFFSSLFP